MCVCRSLVYVFVRETNADICGTLSTPHVYMSLTARRICARVCVDVSVVSLRVMVRTAARERLAKRTSMFVCRGHEHFVSRNGSCPMAKHGG